MVLFRQLVVNQKRRKEMKKLFVSGGNFIVALLLGAVLSLLNFVAGSVLVSVVVWIMGGFSRILDFLPWVAVISAFIGCFTSFRSVFKKERWAFILTPLVVFGGGRMFGFLPQFSLLGGVKMSQLAVRLVRWILFVTVVGLPVMIVLTALIFLLTWLLFGKEFAQDLLTLPLFYWAKRWAKKKKLFVSIPEGFAVLVVEGGEYVKTLVQWEGWTTDSEGNIISGEEPEFLGGLFDLGGIRWLGLKGQVYSFHFRYHSIREDGTAVEHDEDFEQVMLKTHPPYLFAARDVEDKGNVPVDLEFPFIMRVFNPRKFVFEAQDSLEIAFSKIEPVVTGLVGQWDWQDIRSEKETFETELWEKLKSVRSYLKDELGILILEMPLRRIIPPEAFAESSAEAQRAEGLGKAAVVEAQRAGEARAGAIRSFLKVLFG